MGVYADVMLTPGHVAVAAGAVLALLEPHGAGLAMLVAVALFIPEMLAVAVLTRVWAVDSPRGTAPHSEA